MKKKLLTFLKKPFKKISNFIKALTIVLARLIGIKKTVDGYNSNQLSTALWIIIFGIPTGILIGGLEFPVLLWVIIVLGLLAITNLDEALILTASYAEKGKETI